MADPTPDPLAPAGEPPVTEFERRLRDLAAPVDLEKNEAAKWRPVSDYIAGQAGLQRERVRAIGATDLGTLESRLCSIGVIKADPQLFLVFTTLAVQIVLERVRNLVPLTRHLRTVVVLEGNPDWRARAVLDVRPYGVGPAIQHRFPSAQLLVLDEEAQTLPGVAPTHTGAWILLDSAGSDYANIDGIRYRYPSTIPNGKQISEGDTIVSLRTVNAPTPDAGCVYGIGRAGHRHERMDGKREVYFDRYQAIEPAIQLSELGNPRNNPTNAITAAPAAWVEALLERLGYTSIEDLPTPVSALSMALVQEELADRKLFLPEGTVLQAVAALWAGKHLMLTGPPGTGKTTFAEALGEAASRVGLASAWSLTTGTADWTSADTVGAYRLTLDNELEFSPGQILQAVDQNEWLVIDELNRADIDKAIGQLFTVLSGQGVVLPFQQRRSGVLRPVAIVPYGAEEPADCWVHPVRRSWRLLATMNDRDKDLLFELSEALLRRFAVIDVPPPPTADLWAKLLKSKGQTGDQQLDVAVSELTNLPHRRLGPAVVLDAAAHLQTRRLLADELSNELDRAAAFAEAVELYIRPHLRTLAPHQVAEVDGFLKALAATLVGERSHASKTEEEAEIQEVLGQASPEQSTPIATNNQ